MATAQDVSDLRVALDALDRFPAFAEPAERLAALVDHEPLPVHAAVAAVEGDVALAVAVLRAANAQPGPWEGRVDSVVQAVGLLGAAGVRAATAGLARTDYLAAADEWGGLPDRMRRHATATARAADRLAVHTGVRERDRLVTAALLHDVGTIVMPAGVAGDAFGLDRCAAEREALGLDHAAAGALALRDAGLPGGLVIAVAAHHAPDPGAAAAYVHLADLLAHEAAGDPVDRTALHGAAAAIGLGPAELRAVLFDLPDTGGLPDRVVDPCPLSERELEVLVELARGSVYKQIAQDLALSTSTVRTHLHNIYGKLGAVDRAQAVLIARQRGWL
jgi:DNA-binding NarL/FixJ family response regulator